MTHIRVDIGIPTFRRPELLTSLIVSLARMDHVPKCRVRIIVVDNDVDGSAADAASKIATNLGLDLAYIIEKDRGISQARNRILGSAKGDYLAFLDDDETVTSGWLRHMLNAIDRFDADVVFGPVKGVLPMAAPQWSRMHPCFNPTVKPTGARLTFGGCGNVMMKAQWIADGRFRFDPKFSFTGGEDTDFFYRLSKAGAKMVWASNAVVFEHVPPERLTVTWVTRRAFRSGQCFIKTIGQDLTRIARTRRFARRLVQAIIGVTCLAAVAIFSRKLAVPLLTKIASAFGELSTMVAFGANFEEYAPTRYRGSGTIRH